MNEQIEESRSCKDPKLLVASLLLIVRPGAPSSVLVPSSDALAPSSGLYPKFLQIHRS